MNLRKRFVSTVLMVAFAVALFAVPSSAFEFPADGKPAEGAVISGPELWGVFVYNCGQHVVLRVKRVQDCVVEVKTVIIDEQQTCDIIENGNNLMYYTAHVTLFDETETRAAIVTKVKNFDKRTQADGTILVSADVQIQFISN